MLGLATLAVLFGTPAAAADMRLKAPPPEVAAWSWTGCYVGTNGGFGWNNGHTSYQSPNPTADPINFRPNLVGGAQQYIATPEPRGSGGLAGIGGGCNWQSRQRVVGIEADADWANISGSDTRSALGQFGIGPNAFTTFNPLPLARRTSKCRCDG